MDLGPQVSVIVPVFNAGKRLIPSIESLLSQSLKSIEIIIVNDASTDETATVVDQLARENSNIIPIHFTENKGVHEARLAGLKKSTAPWIGFLDADDFARPTMFSDMIRAGEENSVDIVICGSYRVTDKRKVIAPKLRFLRSERVEDRIFARFCTFEFGTGMLWNKLFKREVIEPWFNLHFPWRQSINEDLLLNIGCFYNSQSIFLLKDMLHEYVLSDASVTKKMDNSWAYVETFRAYALAIKCYQHLGDQPISNIIDMYRNQISWGDYQITEICELVDYKERLDEAVRFLSKETPYALAAISARSNSSMVGGRLAMKSLYVAIVKRLRNIIR